METSLLQIVKLDSSNVQMEVVFRLIFVAMEFGTAVIIQMRAIVR